MSEDVYQLRKGVWVKLSNEASKRVVHIIKSVEDKQRVECLVRATEKTYALYYEVFMVLEPTRRLKNSRGDINYDEYVFRVGDKLFVLTVLYRYTNKCFDTGVYIGLDKGKILTLRKLAKWEF